MATDYAVVQNEPTMPSPDSLETAFKVLSDLVDIDADTLSNDAYGIITDGLSHSDAQRLCVALNAEGVSTCVVPESDFPKLIPAKQIRRLDCTPGDMLLYDTLGRAAPILWDQVIMVAAGLVTVSEFKRSERDRIVVRGTGHGGGSCPILLTDVSTKEEQNIRPMLEIYMTVDPTRIAVHGHEFQYNYLGDRLQLRYMDNFALLVQDVTTFAASAILNRGAMSLRDDNTVTYHYPTRHAFEEEIVWSLWRCSLATASDLRP